MLINDAWAQAAAAGTPAQGSLGGLFVNILLVFIIVYLIILRPQQKKIKQHEAMLMAIKRGDKVITGGGIIAKVEKVNGEDLDVRVAENTVITIKRMTVRDVVTEEVKTAAPQKASEKNTRKKNK